MTATRTGRPRRSALRTSARLLVGLVLVAATGVCALASLPRLLGYETLVILSGSMGTTAPKGSLVVGKPKDVADVAVGDVILMRKQEDGGSTPVLHRVITREELDGQVVVHTQGDANPSPDPEPFVLQDRITTPSAVLPFAGYLVGFAGTRLGWVVLIMLPMVLLCAVRLMAIWSSEDQESPTPWTVEALPN